MGIRIRQTGSSSMPHDGVALCKSIFSSIAPDAWAHLSRTYDDIVHNRSRRVWDVEGDSDFGKELEWTAFFVYYKENCPLGIAGLYRKLESPRDYWLGLIGISSNWHGMGIGLCLLEHIISLAKQLGANSFSAYTDDSAENYRAHQFYEKAGMKNSCATLMEGGKLQRIYRIQFQKI